MKIRTTEREVVSYTLNDVQQLYNSVLEEEYPEFRGIREAILKSRQLGFSTFIAAKFFIDTISTPNTQTVVIAQDQGSTEKLFQIVRRFQNTLPKSLQLPTRYDTKNVLYWPTIDSYYFVGTAGSKKIGRGGTINNVHASEVAFWDNPQEIVAGLMEAVPETGNIFLETTANGVGGWFYDEYWNAVARKSVFKARFYPWFYETRYSSKELTSGEDFERNEEEIAYVEKVRQYWNGVTLSDQQLIWRRNKTLTLRKKFRQEYPITPDEAFVASGQGFFTEESLARVETQLVTPQHIEVPKHYIHLRQLKEDELVIWSRPRERGLYVIGVDPSEGLNEKGTEHDYSPAQVLDYSTWEQVARVFGRFEPDALGHIVNELGRMYNMALLNVERNNHGHSVINTLLNQCGYPLQKGHEVSGLYTFEEFDARKPTRLSRPGWPQNQKTRMLVVNSLFTAMDEGTILIRDIETWRQLRTFSKLPSGKVGGESGTHDDLVMALGLATVVLTKVHPKLEKKKVAKSVYGSYR